LTALQNEIKARQQSIQRLKTFNRSCQVHLVLLSSIFYGGYTVFLFLQYKLGINSSVLNKSSITFLLLFPFGIFYFKKVLAGVFNFFVIRKQNVLKDRQAQLKDRIEELKVETRFYQTKDLIEKYDKSPINSKTETEVTRRPVNSTTSKVNNSRNNLLSNSNLTVQRSPPSQHQVSPLTPPQYSINFRNPSPPFRSPTWMDRFMDALIGDDSRNQKYALICSQCFNHNGLATPELFETVRYRCPNCGFFNVNNNSKKKKKKEDDADDEKIEEIKTENESNLDNKELVLSTPLCQNDKSQ
jgi:endoplasmic reticulum junction formation protein lunapark